MRNNRPTIIKITFTQYPENACINYPEDLDRLREIIKTDPDFVKVEIVQNGKFLKEVKEIIKTQNHATSQK